MKKAFTLIELLVVIAIIALLAGILFPVFAQVREKGRTTTCLAHMQQMGTAIQMYAQDYDETYPTLGLVDVPPPNTYLTSPSVISFTELITPYTKTINIKCPRIPDYPNINKKFLTGYAMNQSLGIYSIFETYTPHKTGFSGRYLSQVHLPSLSVMLAEARTGVINVLTPDIKEGPLRNPLNMAFQDLLNVTNAEKEGSTRHMGGSNYVFCDGHTKWYKPDIFFDLNASKSQKDPTFRVTESNFNSPF
jgi:prepilin-type N-terminal cleavage/methylation domain-containing protein/prepilin-type processing-associated H-X9-DG protein